MSESGFGPLAHAQATLVELRKAFAGYEVVPLNSDGLEYRVSLAGTKLFDVIPDEAGHVLNVHVVTPKVEIQGHPWRVGEPFTNVEQVTTCECWGDQTVCFKDGEHVAVALAKICREGAPRQSLAGVTIRTAIWSAHPLAPGGYAPAGSTDASETVDPP